MRLKFPRAILAFGDFKGQESYWANIRVLTYCGTLGLS